MNHFFHSYVKLLVIYLEQWVFLYTAYGYNLGVKVFFFMINVIKSLIIEFLNLISVASITGGFFKDLTENRIGFRIGIDIQTFFSWLITTHIFILHFKILDQNQNFFKFFNNLLFFICFLIFNIIDVNGEIKVRCGWLTTKTVEKHSSKVIGTLQIVNITCDVRFKVFRNFKLFILNLLFLEV